MAAQQKTTTNSGYVEGDCLTGLMTANAGIIAVSTAMITPWSMLFFDSKHCTIVLPVHRKAVAKRDTVCFSASHTLRGYLPVI